MSFSEQHANFLVNYGDGTFEDAIYLIAEAKKKSEAIIKKRTGGKAAVNVGKPKVTTLMD